MLNWWKGALIYQIYPRSFYDSNNDGIGDLAGITQKMDYIASLNVDAIWISPFFTSPMKDFGYDIADYCDVDPMFGDLAQFKRLVEAAHQHDIKVVIDQVISHSSDAHAWFKESRQSRDDPRADWYVWADPAEGGGSPNNWLAFFGGSAWTFDDTRGQYYLHNFLVSQPDLNFHNPEVQQAQLDNLRFWLELGVDGFRLDVTNFYFHDELLRDNPVLPDGIYTGVGVSKLNPYAKLEHIYDITQPENIAFIERLRRLMNEYGATMTMGEVNGEDSLQIMADYTRGDGRLHMAYTFDLLGEDGSVEHIHKTIATIEAQGEDCWPCWALGNHDVMRVVSRWNQNEAPHAFALVAMAMLVSLRGTVCLYQGDELALPEAEVGFEDLQDPYGIEFWPQFKGRDGCRTPLPWTDAEHGGFSEARPWLPVDERHIARNISAQQANPDSTLQAVQSLLAWRNQQPALKTGRLQLKDCRHVLVFERHLDEERMVCVFNLGADTQTYTLVEDATALEGHGFTSTLAGRKVTLPPYQAFYATLN